MLLNEVIKRQFRYFALFKSSVEKNLKKPKPSSMKRILGGVSTSAVDFIRKINLEKHILQRYSPSSRFCPYALRLLLVTIATISFDLIAIFLSANALMLDKASLSLST